MAGIPSLVGFDFTYGMGSQTPAMARLLADAGENLAKSIETFATRNEATSRAPQMSQIYAAGYAKIADGDFSGFSDLTAASSMAAGNPMLMQMAKEANDLGTQLASNYTTTQLTRERLRAEALRTTAAEDRTDQRYQWQAGLQEDRQAEAERQAAIKQNMEIRERNNKRKSVTAVTGEQPQLEQEVPVPEPRKARSLDDTSAKLDVGDGLLPALPEKNAPDNAVTQAATADRVAAETGAPMQQGATQQTPPQQGAPAQQGAATDVSSTRKLEPGDGELMLGDKKIVVKALPSKMKVAGKSVNSETGAVTTDMKPDEDMKKAREEFIEGVSEMQGKDPQAAKFFSQFLGNGKGVTFPPEGIVRERGKVTSAQMYGVSPDGKLKPYNPEKVKDKDGKDKEVAGTVSGEFYDAHTKAVKNMDKVRPLIEFVEPPQAKLPDPSEKLKAHPELLKVKAQLDEDVKNGLKPEQAQLRYKAAEKAYEEKLEAKKAGVTPELEKAVEKERRDKQLAATTGKRQRLREQIKEIDDKLRTGKETVRSMNFMGSGASGGLMTGKLPPSEIKKLMLMRAQLEKKLDDLEG